jgi:hypothetical protein
MTVAEKGQQNGYKWIPTQRVSFSHRWQEKKAVRPITTEDALKTVLHVYTSVHTLILNHYSYVSKIDSVTKRNSKFFMHSAG